MSGDKARTLLGAGDSTAASYTAAYVVQPISANVFGVDGGGKTTGLNSTIWGDAEGKLVHAFMDDGGTCKFGVHHTNADASTEGGTTPVVWPGGWGAWGLVWMSYTNGGNVRVRINGSNVSDETSAPTKAPSPLDTHRIWALSEAASTSLSSASSR
ncbi:MAG: hypothetical protein IPQ09_31090 [Myxococcales bacterium]|nr:hypothetical protein [Myxococcales bacterium]